MGFLDSSLILPSANPPFGLLFVKGITNGYIFTRESFIGRSLVFKVCLFTGPSVLFFINRSMGKEIKSFIEISGIVIISISFTALSLLFYGISKGL